MTEQIRRMIHQIIQEHGHLNTAMTSLDDDSDLYQAGLTSHACVTLMLALEEAFDIEFPERMLRRQTFETIANIRDAIGELTQGRSAVTA